MKKLGKETIVGLVVLALIIGFLTCKIFSPTREEYIKYEPVLLTNVIIMQHPSQAIIRHYKKQNAVALLKVKLYKIMNTGSTN